ncbi:protein-export chaperone SecB [Fructilactobacillus fructivorans]|uniref:protein-export chaperone SecB n=1 Tax=Fructilactobacillus fructivorans TaxID=1614 RepID=UPI000704A32B|nr:protein-export chaperone SecB [Fructilactobacillus fructivorans]KRN12953.1 hypothetical protein IV37_GL000586 [Fructilactobacillus fructivorans]KRN40915.1 hypothetical protein IV51_GL001144 [Fructilactobacillus fructivorans]KRN42616.1 hypothetical protein IV48_GL001364 [Fructilactobacillus fructivorans]
MVNKNDPVINFIGYKVKEINVKNFDNEGIYERLIKKYPSRMKVKTGVSEDNKLAFVEIMVNFNNDKEKRMGTIRVQGNFTVRKGVTGDKLQQYLAVNGAAMIYPYVRSIASIVTSFDSSEATVLSSINFVEEYNKLNHDQKP